MGKLIIERKKSMDLKMPYTVLIDGTEIGKIENGSTKKFDVSEGKHTLIITCGAAGKESLEALCGVTGGLLGALIGKLISKSAEKAAAKKKKNEAIIDISSEKSLTVVCKAGTIDAVIKEIK